MPDPFDLLLAQVKSVLNDEPTGAPASPQELTQNDIAQRFASIQQNLDDLITLSRDFDAPDLQRAIQAEERALGAVLVRAQLLCSFIEASKPRGLRLVGRRQ